MKKIKKTLSIVIVLALTVTILPGMAFATDEHWAFDVVNQLDTAYDGIFTANDYPVRTEDAEYLFGNELGYDADVYFVGADTEDITRLELCRAVWNMSGLALPAGVTPVEFADCTEAEVGSPAAAAIGSLAAIGVVSGTGGGNFEPYGEVTNAELAVVVYRTMNKMGGIKVAKGILEAGDGRVGFSDVFPSDWYYDGIMYLYYNGIVYGHPEGDFDPDGKITNAELTALLVRAQAALEQSSPPDEIQAEFTALTSGGAIWTEYPQNYFSGFDDIDEFDSAFEETFTAVFTGQEWSKPFFWVNREYFLAGQATSDINPSANTTRETMAYISTMLYEGYDSNGYDSSDVNISILDRFDDADNIGDDYRPAMAYLVSIGALKGNANGELLPQTTIDRATAGVFWARVMRGLDTSKLKDYKDLVNSAIEEVSGGEE